MYFVLVVVIATMHMHGRPLYFAVVLFFSVVPEWNSTRLCCVFGNELDLKPVVQTLGLPPRKTWDPKTAYFPVDLYDTVI